MWPTLGKRKQCGSSMIQQERGIVSWALAVGTTGQTPTTDEWLAGAFQATANQVNLCDAVNNEFKVTQVQFHEGIDEIPFEELMRDFQTEELLCLRYFEKLPNSYISSRADNGYCQWQYKAVKRALPTLTNTDIGVIHASHQSVHGASCWQNIGNYPIWGAGSTADAEL